jgi:hypothetical protein
MEMFKVIDKLEKNQEVFNNLLKDINENQARWKPSPVKWSVLEVVHHLYDEEREDFRLRLQYTLANPEKKWTSIDPPRWAKDRKYNEQNFIGTANKFYREREKSIKWLKHLQSPNWNKTHNHPSLGVITAGDLLVSWLAHDFLHFHQIVTINLEHLKVNSLPFNARYAMP